MITCTLTNVLATSKSRILEVYDAPDSDFQITEILKNLGRQISLSSDFKEKVVQISLCYSLKDGSKHLTELFNATFGVKSSPVASDLLERVLTNQNDKNYLRKVIPEFTNINHLHLNLFDQHRIARIYRRNLPLGELPILLRNKFLYLAICQKDADFVRDLIADPSLDLFRRCDGNRTPLTFAAGKGSLEIFQCLLDDPRTDFKEVDDYGQTALHVACIGKDVEKVNCLISSFKAKHSIEQLQAYVQAKNIKGHSAAYFALYNDDDIALKALIDAGANPEEIQEGHRLIYLLPINGNGNCCRVLLEVGVDIRSHDGPDGTSPLQLAFNAGNVPMISSMVSWGFEKMSKEEAYAWLNQLDGEGQSPFSVVSANKIEDIYGEIVKQLRRHYPEKVQEFTDQKHQVIINRENFKVSLLVIANLMRLPNLERTLMRDGASLINHDYTQSTIYQALEADDAECLKVLAQKNAIHVNQPVLETAPPIPFAVFQKKNKELNSIPKSIRLTTDPVHCNGATLLQISAAIGAPSNCQYLLASGADRFQKTEKMPYSPPMLAVMFNQLEELKLLIGEIKSPEVLKEILPDLLYTAAERSLAPVVRYILSLGPEAMTPSGKSPLYAAIQGNSPEVLQLVLDAYQRTSPKLYKQLMSDKAFFAPKKNSYFSALDIAKDAKNPEIPRILAMTGANFVRNQALYEQMIVSACKEGDTELLNVLLPLNPAAINQPIQGESLIHHALDARQQQVVSLLAAQKDIDLEVENQEKRTCLQSACTLGHGPLTRILIEAGANVDGTTLGGDSVLTLAVLSNYPEPVQEILKSVQGTGNLVEFINRKNSSGIGALFVAVRMTQKIEETHPIDPEKRERAVKIEGLLIKAGASLKDAGGSPRDFLNRSAVQDALETFAFLLNLYPDELNKLHEGIPLIGLATNRGSKKVVEFLGSQDGIDLEIVMKNGQTCLQLAASLGNDTICKILIEAGSNIDAVTSLESGQYTSLHLAAYYGQLKVVQLLASYKKSKESLLTYINQKNVRGHSAFQMVRSRILTTLHADPQKKEDLKTRLYSVLSELVILGTTLDSSSDEPLFVLHLGAQLDNTPLMEAVLSLNSDLINVSFQGNTPLSNAVSTKSLRSVEYLVKKPNIDLETISRTFHTPLQSASAMGFVAICKILLNAGADIDAITSKDDGEFTALMLASHYNRLEVVKLLIEHKEKEGKVLLKEFIDFETEEAPKSLTLALKEGNSLIVTYLLSKGASIELEDLSINSKATEALRADFHKIATDRNGRSPLHFAALAGDSALVAQCLQNLPKDPQKAKQILEAKDNLGYTPHHLLFKAFLGVRKLMKGEAGPAVNIRVAALNIYKKCEFNPSKVHPYFQEIINLFCIAGADSDIPKFLRSKALDFPSFFDEFPGDVLEKNIPYYSTHNGDGNSLIFKPGTPLQDEVSKFRGTFIDPKWNLSLDAEESQSPEPHSAPSLRPKITFGSKLIFNDMQ